MLEVRIIVIFRENGGDNNKKKTQELLGAGNILFLYLDCQLVKNVNFVITQGTIPLKSVHLSDTFYLNKIFSLKKTKHSKDSENFKHMINIHDLKNI